MTERGNDFPGDGALAVLVAIRFYAIGMGVMLIIMSASFRNVGRTLA